MSSAALLQNRQTASPGCHQPGNDFLRNGSKRLHRRETYEAMMEKTQAKKGRTPRERRLTKHETLRLVSNAIHEDYGPLASRHKVIAEDAGANSDKTAEAWTAAISCPGLHHFLNLGMNSPAIQKMVLRLWNLDPDIDPEYQRAFMDLVRAVQR